MASYLANKVPRISSSTPQVTGNIHFITKRIRSSVSAAFALRCLTASQSSPWLVIAASGIGFSFGFLKGLLMLGLYVQRHTLMLVQPEYLVSGQFAWNPEGAKRATGHLAWEPTLSAAYVLAQANDPGQILHANV